MYFLQPIALASIAALLLPLLVHLWHRKKGRTLKIGSIRLFTGNTRQQRNKRVIREWPLFIIRCLLLLALTMVIARPILVTESTAKKTKGWIVSDAGSLGSIYRQHRNLVDSLLADGYSLHDAQAGYKQLALDDSIQDNNTTTIEPWNLVQSLDDSLPEGFPVRIFAGNRQSSFSGHRPLTRLNLAITLFDEGNQLPDSLLYHQVAADTSAFRVAVINQKNGEARYLLAALRAIGEYQGRRLLIEEFNGNMPATGQDLIISSSGIAGNDITDSNKPDILSQLNSRLILLYPDKTTDSVQTEQLLSTGSTPLGITDPVYVSVDKGPDNALVNRFAKGQVSSNVNESDSSVTNGSVTIPSSTHLLSNWTTADGKTVMGTEHRGNKTIYRMFTRPDLSGGSIVWNETFVYGLMELLFPAVNASARLMPADELQVQPRIITAGIPTTATDNLKQETQTDLKIYSWILLFILFTTERILATKTRSRKLD